MNEDLGKSMLLNKITCPYLNAVWIANCTAFVQQ